METILAKNFSTRQELEAHVSSAMGLTAEAKPEHVIKGTKQELKKLRLGHGKIFWGVRVEETDFVKPALVSRSPVDRGKIHKTKLKEIDIKNSKESDE